MIGRARPTRERAEKIEPKEASRRERAEYGDLTRNRPRKRGRLSDLVTSFSALLSRLALIGPLLSARPSPVPNDYLNPLTAATLFARLLGLSKLNARASPS